MARGGRALIAVGGVLAFALGAGGMYLVGPSLGASTGTDHVRRDPPAELRLERSDRAYPLSGVILAGDQPLNSATVVAGGESMVTDETGAFTFANAPFGPITATHFGYVDASITFDGTATELDIAMNPRIIRALHVSSTWAVNDTAFQRLIDIANVTTVNALVLDAMGDNGLIDYSTTVPAAVTHGLIEAEPYDVQRRLQQAKDAGLYTIVRIMAFKNPAYSNAVPSDVLAGNWMDPANHASWEYPLALAVEACGLGFDEIQFDYVRYPGGATQAQAEAQGRVPDEAGRVANIKAFLQEAADRVHPLGCVLSADSFGEPTVKDGDSGIGQDLEEFSAPLDVYSPMTDPSLWAPGWFDVPDPKNHPELVVPPQLDGALARVSGGTIVRPWLYVTSFADSWSLNQIALAEARGLGWILWTVYDVPFRVGEIPAGTTGEG